MLTQEQVEQWRHQLREEQPNFGRDLAMVLLTEVERLQQQVKDAQRAFVTKHGAIVRAKLAAKTTCSVCSDQALRDCVTWFEHRTERSSRSTIVPAE